MDLKLNSAFKKIAVSTSLLGLAFAVNPAHAVNWDEVGDAGSLVSDAQEALGNGPLRNIYGTLSTNHDVDLYRIYISSPETFSAGVSPTGTGNLDSLLVLFNEAGYGVYGNDNATLGSGNAGLPAGHVFGPQAPGWYNLAVTSWGVVPMSAGGDIGVNPGSPYTQIITASGPGGASALTNWDTTNAEAAIDAGYRLRLSGVSVVPEPETYAMLLAGLGLIGSMVRRRKGSSQ